MIKRILRTLRELLWTGPVTRPLEPKATEVAHLFTCIKYSNQWVNLRIKDELPAWEQMGRKQKRAMANRFKQQEKKGKIRFVEIDGQVTCVKNLDYESRNKFGKSTAR
jgi:hypothetical protein